MKKTAYIGDGVIIIVVLIVGLSPIVSIRGNDRATSFEITINGRVYRTVSASIDTTIIIPGEMGKMALVIKDGVAWVSESSCPRKICIKTGKINQPGQVIACVPNKVLIKALGPQKRREIDAILK